MGFHARRNPFTKRLFSRRPEARLRITHRHQTVRQGHTAQWGHEIHASGRQATEISREVGGAFHVIRRIHHGTTCRTCAEPANRAGLANGGWDPGVYSIVKFELVEQGSGTKIAFDHTGFPKGAAEDLAQDGKHTIGSRSRNSWLRFCGGRIATGGECTDEKKPEPESDKINTPP